jgi:hypothetical protein
VDQRRTPHVPNTNLADVQPSAPPAHTRRGGTVLEQQILLVLAHQDRACPVTRLATDLRISRQAALQAVTALTRDQLVALASAPSYSPYQVHVNLTAKGHALRPKLLDWTTELLTSNLDSMPG